MEFRTDVVQRREDEAAQMQARVGENERVIVQHEIADVEDVEIESARGVTRVAYRAAKRGLDQTQSREQRKRGSGKFHFDDCIQKWSRVRPGADGFRFMDSRTQHWRGDSRQSQDGLAASGEIREAVAKI